jgi:hypothetical protein
MLALGDLEPLLLEYAEAVHANTALGSGWPRGHISLHRTVEHAQLAEALTTEAAGFSGAIRFQARLDYFEKALAGTGIACAVFDPANGSWRAS